MLSLKSIYFWSQANLDPQRTKDAPKKLLYIVPNELALCHTRPTWLSSGLQNADFRVNKENENNYHIGGTLDCQ